MAGVLREVGYGVIELALTRTAGMLAEDELELLKLLAERSQRPITWLALLDRTDMPYVYREALPTVAPYIAGGIRIHPQVTPRPARAYHSLRTPFIFASFAAWKGAFNRSLEEQLALYKTPEFRTAFRQELKGKGGVVFTGQWDRLSVVRVARPEHEGFLNKSIEEVAALTGKDPVDTLLDLEPVSKIGFVSVVILSAAKNLVTWRTIKRFFTPLRSAQNDIPYRLERELVLPDLFSKHSLTRGSRLSACDN